MNKLKKHNVIHIFFLLLLAYVVILYVTNDSLLLTDNTFVAFIKDLTALTLYKVVIISFTEVNHRADLYISLLYLIFIALFINIHIATREKVDIYLQNLAFYNWHSFSGVIGFHIYDALYPRLHLYSKENYNTYRSNTSNKKLNEFLIEQLNSKGAHAYFTFMFLFGFVALPFIAILRIDTTAMSVANFQLVCVLMIYFQIKTIFEALLICRAYISVNKEY